MKEKCERLFVPASELHKWGLVRGPSTGQVVNRCIWIRKYNWLSPHQLRLSGWDWYFCIAAGRPFAKAQRFGVVTIAQGTGDPRQLLVTNPTETMCL